MIVIGFVPSVPHFWILNFFVQQPIVNLSSQPSMQYSLVLQFSIWWLKEASTLSIIAALKLLIKHLWTIAGYYY